MLGYDHADQRGIFHRMSDHKLMKLRTTLDLSDKSNISYRFAIFAITNVTVAHREGPKRQQFGSGKIFLCCSSSRPKEQRLALP